MRNVIRYILKVMFNSMATILHTHRYSGGQNGLYSLYTIKRVLNIIEFYLSGETQRTESFVGKIISKVC